MTAPKAPTPERRVGAHKLWVPISALGGMLVLAAAGGSELRSIRLAIEANTARDEQILDAMKDRPTAATMESAILKAMRPIDSGMAGVQAELRALSDRVRRLESDRD